MSVVTGKRDDSESLPNPTRGCGHLKRGKAYIVGAGFSPDGVLPTWVECDPHVPFREIGTEGQFTRSYKRIDGLTLQLALEDLAEFVPHYPNEIVAPVRDRDELEREARENHVKHGVYSDIRGCPTNQADRHIDRVRERGVEGGTHWGDIPAAEATDLLLRAGATYYPAPQDYAREAIQHGLSKAIPITKGSIPAVVSGVTRCWIMHPQACPGYGGGIIGFAYVSEVAFTEPDEGELPAYIEAAEEAGEIAVRDIEDPPVEVDEDEDQLSVADFEEADDDGE